MTKNKQKGHKKSLLGAILLTVLIMGLIVVYILAKSQSSTANMITNFADCMNAGYTIERSMPQKCVTPDGTIFFDNENSFSPANGGPSIGSFRDCQAAGYAIAESMPRRCYTPDGRFFVEDMKDGTPPVNQEPTDSGSQIVLSGRIDCLPKLGNGEQTMECALGLKGDDDKYYALKDLNVVDPDYHFAQNGLQVEVTGTFKLQSMSGPDGNQYDIAGVIDVESIKESTAQGNY